MMNKFLRRFSQGDLLGENDDDLNSNEKRNAERTSANLQQQAKPASSSVSNTHISNVANTSNLTKQMSLGYQPQSHPRVSPSAPSTPTKSNTTSSTSISSFSAMMSAARDILASNTSVNTLSGQQNNSFMRQSTNSLNLKDKNYKVIFVIDDSNVDWSRYFKNRKMLDLFDIRVEQASFKEINLASYTDAGTMIDILVERNGSKVVRSFKPDFVLVRQNPKNASNDWKRFVIGLKYGCVPSLNSLDAVYNFTDKPWVFGHLIEIQKNYGAEMFPLINQTFHPDFKEIIRSTFPCIIKVGHAHQGLGKIKVENALDLQDIASIVSISGSYSTTEPYIDSKCDIHIQKIGDNYKAYMRRSITGNWKVNNGSSMLEQIPMNERYKFWIDQVSKMFGGLDICAVQVIVSNENNKEYIVDVSDCCLSLFGESQDNDRRQIADLCIEKMIQHHQNMLSSTSTQSIITDASSTKSSDLSLSMKANPQLSNSQNMQPQANTYTNTPQNSNNKQPSKPLPYAAAPPPPSTFPNKQQQQPPSTGQIGRDGSSTSLINSQSSLSASSSTTSRTLPNPPSRPHSPKVSQSTSNVQNQSSIHDSKTQNYANTDQRNLPNRQISGQQSQHGGSVGEDGEDTMNNLRKTFAGIFGQNNI